MKNSPIKWHEEDSSIINYEVYDGRHLEIEHDGTARWVDLQNVKNHVWGEEACAKEYYPPAEHVVNGNSTEFHYRHLWLMSDDEAWDNMRKDKLY